jgi:superfamily II DNA or RNA helicase
MWQMCSSVQSWLKLSMNEAFNPDSKDLEVFMKQDNLRDQMEICYLFLFKVFSVLAFFVPSMIASTSVAATVPEPPMCQLMFVHPNASESLAKDQAQPKKIFHQILNSTLPEGITSKIWTNCGPLCWQLSDDILAKYPQFPTLRWKFSGTRSPHLVLTEKFGFELSGKQKQMLDPEKPEDHIYTTDKTLILPKDWEARSFDEAEAEPVQSALMQLLLGHPLHPYSESPMFPNKPFRWKPSQLQALKAMEEARALGEKSLLVVGSGGTGKTKVITTELHRRIRKQEHSDKKFYLVIANTVEHAQSLERKIRTENIQNSRLLRWDGHVENKDLETLYRDLQQKDQALILVTVINSFREKIYEDIDYHSQRMQKYLSEIIIDEAHHAGAELLRGFLQKVMTLDSNKKQNLQNSSEQFPFLLGLTATPVHREVGLQDLFGQSVFFMNIDKQYQHHKQERSLTEVMDQVQRTSDVGETTPLENVHILTPEILGISREELTIPNWELTKKEPSDVVNDPKNSRRILNPEAYSQVFGLLSPIYKSDKAILTTAGSIASAEHMYDYFQKAFPDLVTEKLHSGMKESIKEKIIQEFRQGIIQHLIVVDMMSEAFDKPDLEVLVDLSISSSPTQMIQRLARPARLHDLKEQVRAVMLLGVTDQYIDEQLQLLDRLNENRKKSILTRSYQRSPFVMKMIRLPDLTENYSLLRSSLQSFWKKRVRRTQKEWINEISKWVRQQVAAQSIRLTPAAGKEYADSLWEYQLGAALSMMKGNCRKSCEEKWWKDFPEDIQIIWEEAGILEKKQRSQQEWIDEISKWVRQQVAAQSTKLTPVAGKEYADNLWEAQLGSSLNVLKLSYRKNGEEKWWKDFPEDIQTIWEEAGILEKKQRSQQEWIDEISKWVRQQVAAHSTKLIPSKRKESGESLWETRLGKGFDKVKIKYRKNGEEKWWKDFPEDIQTIWEEAGILEKKQRSHLEWIDEISKWVRQQVAADSTKLIPSNRKSYAETLWESQLGGGLNTLKKDYRKNGEEKWWKDFPKDIQEFWRREGKIPPES